LNDVTRPERLRDRSGLGVPKDTRELGRLRAPIEAFDVDGSVRARGTVAKCP